MTDSTIAIFERYVVDNWNKNFDGTPHDGGLRDNFIMTTGFGGEASELLDLVLAAFLAKHAGRTLEHLKKEERNHADKKQEILLEAGDVLHYLVRIIHRQGYCLDDVMLANMDKLDKRFKREPFQPEIPGDTGGTW